MASLCTFCGEYNEAEQPHNSTPHCSHCGPEPCDSCRLLAGVEQRVQAKTALRRALDERRQLKTEINRRNDPVTSRLPAELVCWMFSYCVQQTTVGEWQNLEHWPGFWSRKPFQLVLGAVCRSWRTIAWSYPQLWSSIDVFVSQTTPPSYIALIKEWVGRSGHLPLAIRTEFKSYEQEDSSLGSAMGFLLGIVDPLITILNLVAHRWLLFFARMPIHYLGQLRSQAGHATHLRGLILQPDRYGSDPHKCVFDLGMEAWPEALYISGYQLQNVRVGLKNLTHFVGKGLAVADCTTVFMCAPQMVECTLDNLINSESPPSTPVVHPNLKMLHIGDHSEILDFITLPSLTNIYCNLGGDPFGRSLTQFVTRSACPLVDAAFDEASGDDADLIQFLQHTPSLRKILLGVGDIGEVFLTHFGATTYVPQDSDSARFLPNLQRFEYDAGLTFPWSAVASMAPTDLSQPNVVRRPLTEISFYVYLIESDPEYISRPSLAKILESREKGLSITITDDRDRDVIEASRKYYHQLDLGEKDEM